MSTNTPAQQIFDLLVSKDYDPQTLTKAGLPAESPADAEVINFDYRGASGTDYGTVVVMFGEDNNMTMYFGDNLGKSMEGDDKQGWFDFLYQMRMIAKRNLLGFQLENLTRLKHSMTGQAAIKEGLFESWTGTKTTSWNGGQTQARLMIRHSQSLGENDARYRHIAGLFVETVDGERFKLPFTKLSGGRAMVEHIRRGGRPYDVRGQHITEMVNEINVLSQFRRASQGRVLEGQAAGLAEAAEGYYTQLQRNIKSLASGRGYDRYFESWAAEECANTDLIIEDLRNMFTEVALDRRIEQALPLLSKLNTQGNAMKEVNVFEGWMKLISEGTWALPDTPESQAKLIALMSKELPVGPDAANATEQLYDLVGDDILFDRLHDLADENADADARTVVLSRLEELKDDPSVAQVIGQLKIQAAPAGGEQGVAEGGTARVWHPEKVDIYFHEMPNQEPVLVNSNIPYNMIDSYLDKVMQKHKLDPKQFEFRAAGQTLHEGAISGAKMGSSVQDMFTSEGSFNPDGSYNTSDDEANEFDDSQPVDEGKGDLGRALGQMSGGWSGWEKDDDNTDPNIEKYWYDDGEGGYDAGGTIEHNLTTGEVTVEYSGDEYHGDDVSGTFKNIGDALTALRGLKRTKSTKAPNYDQLGYRSSPGPDDLRKTDRTGRKGTIGGGHANRLKQSIRSNQGTLGPKGVLPEGEDSTSGMTPVDLSSNPSFKQIVDRYTQLVYQGHAGETSPKEEQEYDNIEKYVAQRFGEKGSAHLQKAGETSYWGRDDGHGSGHIRSSNLGRPSQPAGAFRTTKAGKMHSQDVKTMKGQVADRLGRHPEPVLPEGEAVAESEIGLSRIKALTGFLLR